MATSHSRIRLVVGILAFVLSLPTAGFATTTVVAPGTPAHTNIQNAIKFMRDHGSTAAADEIQKRLDEGDIWINDDMGDSNGETSNITKDIELNPSVAFPDRTLNPNSNFTQLMELARTLFHENVHSHHQGFWYAVVMRESGIEREAYTATMLEMEKWIYAEWNQYFDLFFRPLKPMTPVVHLRELDHITRKVSVLNAYPPPSALKYFTDGDKTWIANTHKYWTDQQTTYIQPQVDKLADQLAPQPDPPAGGGTPTTPSTPTTPTTPTTPESPEAEVPPEPEPPPPPPCDPCKGIAAQIQELKGQLTQLGQQARAAQEAAEQAQRNVDNLKKRAANIERELNRAAGTGGSSFDPTTGVTIESYDQGNGTVKVTTRDRNGNVTDEYIRDSSKRKAELADQLEQTRGEITKAEAEAKQMADLAAQAKAAVEEAGRRLEDLVQQLEDCIKKYCTNLTTSEALNQLQLPYDNLDVLRDPTTYNAFDGNVSDAFQQMIIEIRVGNAPGMTVPRGAPAPSRGFLQDVGQPRTMLAALLSWLRPTTSAWLTGARRWSDEPKRPWSIDAREQGRTQAPRFRQPVQMLLTSLGQSTGQAFDLQVFNGTGRPFKLAAQSLVVEPLKDEVKRQVQNGMQQLVRNTAPPVTARINGYCLEFLKAPPSLGTVFRIASPELQQRFAPMRKIMDASRQVQRLGQLRPDSNPENYFNAIRQWAMWTVEQRFTERSFTDAFVEHTRKAVAAQKQQFPKDAEAMLRKAAPNRWADIQRVLNMAGLAAPR